MKNAILFALLILLTVPLSLFAQSNIHAGNNTCEALVICAFPQLLVGTNISQTETQTLINQARNDRVIQNNGIVNNRAELAGRVFRALGRTEIALHFGTSQPEGAVLVGYILEMVDASNVKHFVLAGTNRTPLYNPCNTNGSVISAQEVYVYAR